jgi:group I intron endonuclease
MGIIYILKNKLNEKYYIGQTAKSFKIRFRQHQISHSYIGRSLRKNGINNFDKLILENIPEEELDYWEQHYIQECNSIYPNGYNFQTGGHNNHHLHEETKKKLSEAHKGKNTWAKGKPLTEEHKRKISEALMGRANTWQKNVSLSKETKERISEINKGRIVTEETRRKISKANKGMLRSIEARKKMSETHKGHISWNRGKFLSIEHKKKLSDAHKGKKLPPFTEEHKKKISEAHKGKHHTEETRKKMSLAKKKIKEH